MIEPLQIEIEEASSEIRVNLRQEIQYLANAIKNAAQDLNLPFLLQAVFVTSDFGGTVNRILEEDIGFSEYQPERNEIKAVGKTLCRRNGDCVAFTVVLDYTIVGSEENAWMRIGLLMHEFAHVLFYGREIKRVGVDEFLSNTATRQLTLDRLATLVLDEYEADHFENSFVEGLMTDENGLPWTLLRIDERMETSFPDIFLKLLVEMPERIDEIVTSYKMGQKSLEDALSGVMGFVMDMLAVFAHLSMRYAFSEHWSIIWKEIQDTDAYRRFLHNSLDEVLSQLYAEGTDVPFPAKVAAVGSHIENIYLKCGFRFEDVTEGLYIHINLPAP